MLYKCFVFTEWFGQHTALWTLLLLIAYLLFFQQGKSACRLIVDGVEQTEETEECGEDSSCIRGPYTEGINVAYFCHGVGELGSHSKEDDDGNDCDERIKDRNSSEEGEDEEGGKKKKKKNKKGKKGGDEEECEGEECEEECEGEECEGEGSEEGGKKNKKKSGKKGSKKKKGNKN